MSFNTVKITLCLVLCTRYRVKCWVSTHKDISCCLKKKKAHSLFEESEKSKMSTAFGEQYNYQLRKFTLAVHVLSYIKVQPSEVKLV